MAISPFGGFILLLSSIAGVVVGIMFSRIAAEFILIVFRINEHLGAIRDQGASTPAIATARPTVQVLNRKCMTSPSATTYSLPSSRSLPASRAPASPPSAT